MATKVIPVPPELSTPEIHAEFAAHQRAVQHFIAHHEKLREQYPDQWIAVWVDEAAVPTVLELAYHIARPGQARQRAVGPFCVGHRQPAGPAVVPIGSHKEIRIGVLTV